ncbi:MAG: Xaa-Pro peptidase family protein [Treponema sp.]|jgi:Xaa-Pro dipeptidase|nr:Xaa-Pro peptidase family protein [Treponema sp.]
MDTGRSAAANHYQARLEKIWDWMAQEGIALVMFEDTEGRRDANIRWLTGQPGDALLFLSLDRKSLLVPWDIILAKAYARTDAIVPYNEFDRKPMKAIKGAIERLNIPAGSKIEIPPVTPYPVFLDFVAELQDFDIICRDRSTMDHALDLRSSKDAEEIAIIRKAAVFTNKIIDILERKARAGKIKTETDAVMLIEIESRKMGCDGAAFEILAAGQGRSFGIHAFPAWTDAPFGGQGLSILDFGVRYCGYNTDVTLTFVRDPSQQQLKMVNLVEKAYKVAVDSIAARNDTMFTAILVEEFLAKSRKRLVHGLGHGIGLDVHEYPFLRSRHEVTWDLEPGMIFTIEPGLYDPVHGGCRLENDFLITEDGFEILTQSRIIWL